ncbi:MAG: Crp/Fnr family transcriptional regulator [Acidobacteria bacterium]|nr:Crp/Fnr family transcriptional regulator [Acidobacteriota bacterium]
MRSPYDLEITETCTGCKFCVEGLFRNLPLQTLEGFDAIKCTSLYPKGALLFVEGQAPRGIYVLCAGRAKLATGSSEGKMVIARLAEPGEVLGLSATLSGEPYHLSAETLESCQADFVKRDDFLRFLREHPEVCLRVVEILSDILQAAHKQTRSFGKIHSSSERLANLLLSWCEQLGAETQEGIRLKIALTHQEIAQMIGASRETVSRLMSELKRRQIISVDDSGLLIRNRAALAAKARP